MNASTSCPRASVIMRCKNSDWVIGQTLAALFSQDFRDFELIVVDSGSQDGTLDLVRQYPCQLIEIEPTAYVPGAVLNMAAEQARGELLVFLNSDTVPLTADCLRRLLAAFDDAQVSAAFARQTPRPEAETWVRRDYVSSFPSRGEAPPWITLSLPLAAMRREVWARRPFYRDAWASEDTEWGQWARNEGLAIRYVPEAVAMHSHNYTLRQIYGRRFVEGEADAFIYGSDDSWTAALGRAVASTVRDLGAALSRCDWRAAIAAPTRRLVYQWAYRRGRRHGWQRRQSGDLDLSAGQDVILKRHDAATPRFNPGNQAATHS
ncbi:MAG: glycosyltransferase family 2 protein [Planctomycetales bacterium]|nr:glycosyltransferase family 2 protein [Planctomycetales bacterium]